MLGLIILNSSLLFFPSRKECHWYTRLWGLSIGSLFSVFYLFLNNSSGNSIQLENMFFCFDSMSLCLIALTFWTSLMMMLASQTVVKLAKNNISLFCDMVLGLNLILILVFSMSNMMYFYFFFEASLIPTLCLILGWGYQPERLQAGMYMMIYTVAGSLPLLLVIIAVEAMNSSNIFSYMIPYLSCVRACHFEKIASVYKYMSIFAVFFAFLIKLPMFSVHLWLPKAHVEAPVAGSMVLAGILLKLGGFGIFRSFQFFNVYPNQGLTFIVCLALWGGFITSIICFRQVDFKSLIAYSSIGHMSLMLAGVFSLSSWGWSGAVVMMIAHGFCSSALFALANYMYEKSGSRSMIFNKGMLLLLPSLAMWLFLFSAINMAAPPSINLLGEVMIFPSVIFFSKICVVPLGMMSFLAALYSMYLYTCTQHGGSPKYISPFGGLKSPSLTLLFLHWYPVNLLILKSELMFL